MADLELKFDVLVENWYGQLETAKCLSNIVCDSNNRILDRGRAWCQSLVPVPGANASCQCLVPVPGASAWCQCHSPVPGASGTGGTGNWH